MLAIRMQRTGRKGYPTYRVIVQEAHRQPTSGRIVANIGNYNPHTKEVNVDKEKAEFYLKNGAQPSDRVVHVFESQKVSLPDWVKRAATDKKKSIKNPEKLRRNQPDVPVVAEEVSTDTAGSAEVEATSDAPTDAAPAETAEAVEATKPEVTETPESEVESVEEIAESEVADGQVTAEEEVSADAEAADPNASAEDQAEKPA